MFACHYSLRFKRCKLVVWLIRNAPCVGERKRQREGGKSLYGSEFVWFVRPCPSMRSLRNTVNTL